MKIQVGVDYGMYKFDPSNRQVYLYGVGNLTLDQILLITNVTTNTIIYDFSNPLKGGTADGYLLTLTYDTTLMSSTDSLQIFIDIPIPAKLGFLEEQPYGTNLEPLRSDEEYPLNPQLVTDLNLQGVFGSQSLLSKGRIAAEVTPAKDIVISKDLRFAGDELILNLNGHATVTMQVTGSWSGYWTTSSTAGGLDWRVCHGNATFQLAAPCYTLNGSGIWQYSVAGLTAFKVSFSTYTSGIMKVTLVASYATHVPRTITVSGSQSQILIQKSTSPYELYTYDTSPISHEHFVEIQSWDPARIYYYPGDMVLYQGKYYMCILLHSPATAGYIPTNATYWRAEKREPRSLVTRKPDMIENTDALRLRTTSDYADQQRRVQELQYINFALKEQREMERRDYDLVINQAIMQNAGGENGTQYAMGQDSQSHYYFEEIR